MSIDHVD